MFFPSEVNPHEMVSLTLNAYIECLASGKNKDILKLRKKPVVAGNQIRGTCFEPPVLHYRVMTTGQPAAPHNPV